MFWFHHIFSVNWYNLTCAYFIIFLKWVVQPPTRKPPWFVKNSSRRPAISVRQDDGGLEFVFPYGATLNAQKPAVPILSSGSLGKREAKGDWLDILGCPWRWSELVSKLVYKLLTGLTTCLWRGYHHPFTKCHGHPSRGCFFCLDVHGRVNEPVWNAGVFLGPQDNHFWGVRILGVYKLGDVETWETIPNVFCFWDGNFFLPKTMWRSNADLLMVPSIWWMVLPLF